MIDPLNPMSLDIMGFIFFLWMMNCPPVISVLSFATKTFKYIIRLVRPIIYYIAQVSFLSAWSTLLAACFVSLLSLLQHLGVQPGPNHYLVQLLQIKIRPQLLAIHKEQDEIVQDIAIFSEAIAEWNEANAQLTEEIRLAEQVLRKKIRDYEPMPKRKCTQVDCHYTAWKRPAHEPSNNALKRWWNNDDDPRVFEAKCHLDWQRARLVTKKNWYHSFEKENGELTKALDVVTVEKNKVRRQPDFPTFGDFDRRLLRRHDRSQYLDHEAAVKDAMAPVGFEFALKCKGSILHHCLDCGEPGEAHSWIFKYASIAAAAATPTIRPCLAAQGRAMQWRAVPSPVPAQRVLVPSNVRSSQLPPLTSLGPLFTQHTRSVAQAPAPAPAPALSTITYTMSTMISLPAPQTASVTRSSRALDTVRPPSPSRPSIPAAVALTAVRSSSPSLPPSSASELRPGPAVAPVAPDISAVLAPVAATAAPITPPSVPAETKNGGLVTPTSLDFARELETEEAEKEEKRKAELRKEKQKMTRREEEAYEEEEAEAIERAARYRQRF